MACIYFMHELRTPLTSILQQVEAIVDGLFETDNERLQDTCWRLASRHNELV